MDPRLALEKKNGRREGPFSHQCPQKTILELSGLQEELNLLTRRAAALSHSNLICTTESFKTPHIGKSYEYYVR
jgi:hypothetical protein